MYNKCRKKSVTVKQYHTRGGIAYFTVKAPKVCESCILYNRPDHQYICRWSTALGILDELDENIVINIIYLDVPTYRVSNPQATVSQRYSIAVVSVIVL